MLPAIAQRAGKAAVFAAEEFFFGTIRNLHTRRAYLHAVRQFLAWAESRGLELTGIAPRDVGQYLDSLGSTSGIATRKQHLSALRHFFDGMVTRHAIILNPALSVRATASRAGAVAALKRSHFYRAGEQYMLHFREKGGKSREIPVRHDLQEMIFAYLDAAGLRDAPKVRRCFRARSAKRSGSRGRPSTSTMSAA